MNKTSLSVENQKLRWLCLEIKGLAFEAKISAYKLNLVNNGSGTESILNDLIEYKAKLKEILNLCADFLKISQSNEKKSEILQIQKESSKDLRKINTPKNN